MRNNTVVTVSFIVALTFGCGGGTDPTGTTNTSTNTGVCTATGPGAAADCITTGTDTNTATGTGGVAGTGGTTDTGSVSGTGGTGSSTGTGSVTGTSTSTATTVTIPVWFKVGSSQEAILSVLSGAQYANITFVLTKVNADGTWTANTTNCLGSCSGIGKLTGTISETSFKINELSAVGVVPATAPANALTSGTWEFNQSSGTFFTS